MKITTGKNVHTFMYEKFPNILYKYLLARTKEMNVQKLELLNELLEKHFSIKSIDELIKLYINHLKINNYQDKDYYVKVEDVIVNGYKLDSIIRTVDYGNSIFPPYNLFNTSLLYVNNNLEALYKYSYLGVN